MRKAKNEKKEEKTRMKEKWVSREITDTAGESEVRDVRGEKETERLEQKYRSSKEKEREAKKRMT